MARLDGDRRTRRAPPERRPGHPRRRRQGRADGHGQARAAARRSACSTPATRSACRPRPPLGADSTLELDLRPHAAQLSALAAVVLNDDRSTRRPSPGYVTVYPAGARRARRVGAQRRRAGQTQANLVTTAVGTTGAVAFYLDEGGHLIADLERHLPVRQRQPRRPLPAGWRRPGSSTPAHGLGASDRQGGRGRHPDRSTVAGRGGVPATGASAVRPQRHRDRGRPAAVTSPCSRRHACPRLERQLPGRRQDAASQVIVPIGADGRCACSRSRRDPPARRRRRLDHRRQRRRVRRRVCSCRSPRPARSTPATAIGGPDRQGRRPAATVTVQIAGVGGVPDRGRRRRRRQPHASPKPTAPAT